MSIENAQTSMPSLTIESLDPPSESQTSSPLPLPPLAPASTPPDQNLSYEDPGATSPVAPAYSPITPKVQPVFPATYPPPDQYAAQTVIRPDTNEQVPSQQPEPIAPPAQYIPPPPPPPFSSEDSTDAIALRAAISSLQFQKKKAQDDIKALENTKKQALDDPALFRSELAAGRLNERRPQVGNLQAILDQADSDESEDEKEVILGASTAEREKHGHPAEVLDSQVSRATTSSSKATPKKQASAPFDRIPGPQTVVRMPHVNWDKYHVVGEALDSMHEQQRRWPGSFEYGQERGREHVVAAPYSPWLDSLDGQQRWNTEQRNDSIVTPVNATTPTVSEHIMETRRGVKDH